MKRRQVVFIFKRLFQQFQSVEVLKEESDFTYRRWKRMWWENQRAIMKILAHHDSTYVLEGSKVQHEFVQRKVDLEHSNKGASPGPKVETAANHIPEELETK